MKQTREIVPVKGILNTSVGKYLVTEIIDEFTYMGVPHNEDAWNGQDEVYWMGGLERQLNLRHAGDFVLETSEYFDRVSVVIRSNGD